MPDLSASLIHERIAGGQMTMYCDENAVNMSER